MNLFVFLLEWMTTFIVLFFLMKGLVYLFAKKFNRETSIIFSFAICTLIAFILSPHFITFFYPAFIYMPILIFFFIYYFMKEKP